MKLILLFSFLFTLGCASTRSNPYLQLVSESEYDAIIESNTQKKQIYNGFMNILEVSATQISSSVARAQIDQNARLYQWNQEQYSIERAKVETDLTKRTEYFLSFFVPERKHDDLHKPSTKWKVFLDTGGRRYEGSVRKLKTLLAEVSAIYPHHTRWQTPYMVSFPVPASVIDSGEAKITLTGPVTSTTLEFNSVKN